MAGDETDDHGQGQRVSPSRLQQPQASTTSGQPASPLGLRPLGAAGTKVSREAMEGRHDLIEKVLLPRLTDLIKALHAANLAGQIGPGEIALLGELQHWLLQLQVEHDDLSLTLKKPRAVARRRSDPGGHQRRGRRRRPGARPPRLARRAGPGHRPLRLARAGRPGLRLAGAGAGERWLLPRDGPPIRAADVTAVWWRRTRPFVHPPRPVGRRRRLRRPADLRGACRGSGPRSRRATSTSPGATRSPATRRTSSSWPSGAGCACRGRSSPTTWPAPRPSWPPRAARR